MHKPVYLDYAATTPVDERVAAEMCKCLTRDGIFANPASRSHVYGWKAEEAVENARGQLADLIHADPREIVWTSGATESNNLALKGVAFANRDKGRHLITSRIEHKAVLDTFKFLENQGFTATYLEPNSEGLIEVDALESALREDTILVSLMHVNNEIGVVNDIEALGSVCREAGVLFHSDAAQSAGKLLINTTAFDVDLMSFSGHKMYGPKGIGALYVKRKSRIDLQPLIHGGGHERGMRSGTLPTHQIVGMGKAAEIAEQQLGSDNARILSLRNRFMNGLCGLDDWQVNGSLDQRVSGNANISFAGVDGETLLLSLRELAVSTGSACTSLSVEPSYVLKALGVNDDLAHSSIRFSFGRYTTEEEVDFAAEYVVDVVTKLRGQSQTSSASTHSQQSLLTR